MRFITHFNWPHQVNTLLRELVRQRLWLIFLLGTSASVNAQSRESKPRKSEIYFPQAPVPGTWRNSLGLIFTTTPPELTEEIRVSVPAIDLNFQRGINKRLFFAGRFQTQFVQSHLSLGLRWAKPITDRLAVSAGYDVSGWGGALQIKDVFNSQAYGIESMPNISVGYRLKNDLRLTVKSEVILDHYYRSDVGTLAVVQDRLQYNGIAFTIMLEQPFYRQRYVSAGFRAAYSNFNWQLWSIYDTFDRNLFYPQLIFAFIL